MPGNPLEFGSGAFALEVEVLESIRLLIPDLPNSSELLPFLEEIDQNRWYSNNGPMVGRLEDELARFIHPQVDGSEKLSVVTASSGTAALELALSVLGLPRGSRVGVPSFTFPASAAAILRSGHEPVLLDVEPDTWCLDPDLARSAVSELRLLAVIPVAAFGAPLPPDPWDTFADETGVFVIIDAAAALTNQQVGNQFHTVFSLHATKPLGVGEGGIVVSRDEDFARRARSIANFGFESGAINTAGQNAKMSEFHAAVGLVQLCRWDQIRRARLRTLKYYLAALAEIRATVEHQLAPPGAVRSVFPILLSAGTDVADITERLDLRGIQTRRWYYPALHHHPAFSHLETFGTNGSGDLHVTEQLNARLIGLPFHSFLSREQIDSVCSELDDALSQNGR